MNEKQTALADMHRLLLDALRHREQEIFRYLAILGPALGGFVWLLHAGSAVEKKVEGAVQTVTTNQLDPRVFVVGAVSVLLLLLLGAVYSLALGYNYRYITLQLAKLESMLCIKDYMLKQWPTSPQKFLDRYKLFCCKPWCTPPDIINVFWMAFLVGVGGVTLAACLYRPDALVLSIVIPVGTVAFFVGLLAPLRFGKKLHDACEKELREPWACQSAASDDSTGEAQP